MEAGDAVVALSEDSQVFPQMLPPGTRLGQARGPGGHQPAGKATAWQGALPECGTLPDVIYSRAKLLWLFSEPSNLPPCTGSSHVYQLAPRVSSQ